ncbi:MAG: radical SAM protein, partial [Bacillota bacterium]
MKYAEERFFGKEVSFNITTNGTLLTSEMVQFFQDHEVNLMISLDGPKEINDKNRVFANGRGTFDAVMKQIEMIKQVAPDYAKRLAISMVMDPENDFDCINNIFLEGA